MKRIIAFFCVMALMIAPVNVFAANITVKVNGTPLVFDVQPQLINDRTMVPMRKIFESLGAYVTWDEASQSVTGKKDNTVINLTINSPVLFKNGSPIALDVAPTIINDRTLVPVRAIAESFDCNVRWIDATQTVEITASDVLKQKLTASEISDKASSSVFYIEVYDEYDNAVASGSGFFISSDGVAVTNYHVIEDTSSAYIQTTDENVYEITNVLSYDKELDIAIIRISRTDIWGNTVPYFPYLELADSDNIKAGQTVYAIGSPRGLQNTLSSGIISNVNQILDGKSFIQVTAPITHGSSGGALLNEYGEVVGITSAIYEGEGNIGFAIPINLVYLFDLDTEGISYADFANNDTYFELDISEDTLYIEAGTYDYVLVRAVGKDDDWSIYWESSDPDVAYGEWGEWLEEDDSVCPLFINAESAGMATITVYSDVDFIGKEITVYVTNPQIETYYGTNVPSFQAYSGLYHSYDEESGTYIYDYTDDVYNYMKFLLSEGFEYVDYSVEDFGVTVSYVRDGDVIAIGIARELGVIIICAYNAYY